MKEILSPYLLLLFFVALFIIGVNSGEFVAVLEKAIRICLSCIGVG